MRTGIISALLVVTALGACNFRTERPVALQTQTEPVVQSSSIFIPIELPAAEVQSLLRSAIAEQSSGNTLFRESGRRIASDVTLQTIVTKRGSATVTAHANSLEMRLPLRVDLRVDWKKCKRIRFGIGSKRICASKHKDTNAAFTLIATMRPRVTPQYKVKPGIQLDYRLDRGAQIRLGPIRINLVSKTREALSRQMARFEAKLNNQLTNKINLRSKAEKAFASLSKPVAVDRSNNLWLTIKPEAVHAMPLRTSNGSAFLGVGVKAVALAMVGAKPRSRPIGNLPPVNNAPLGEEFLLNLPIAVEFAEVERHANKALIGTKLNLSGNTVEFEEIQAFGSQNGKLIVGVKVHLKAVGDWFGTRGWIYGTGRPVYDEATTMLRVEDFKYDVNTESVLINTAAWALNPLVRKRIESALKANLSPHLKKILTRANTLGKSIALGTLAKGEAVVKKIKLSNISVQSKHLRLVFHAVGSAQVVLKR